MSTTAAPGDNEGKQPNISAAQVKELRERSGAPMMDCKNALSEAKGDIEGALIWLRADAIIREQSKGLRSLDDLLVVGPDLAPGARRAEVPVQALPAPPVIGLPRVDRHLDKHRRVVVG